MGVGGDAQIRRASVAVGDRELLVVNHDGGEARLFSGEREVIGASRPLALPLWNVSCIPRKNAAIDCAPTPFPTFSF